MEMIFSWSHQYFDHMVITLRLYYILKISIHYYDLHYNHSNNPIISSLLNEGFNLEEASLKYLLLKSCDSLLPVFSLASFISIFSRIFHHHVLRFMLVDDPESSHSAGSLAGCLFLIVCFQCGLTSLPDEDRYWRLLRNLGLIVIVNLHNLYKPVSERLQSLSASRSKTIHKHLRVLLIGFLSILIPVTFLIYLWFYSSINSWTMAVAVFGFEMVFRVSISTWITIVRTPSTLCEPMLNRINLLSKSD